MSMTNTHRDHLISSARTKLKAARHLIMGRSKHPSPAVYLSHVTLECALKVRILANGKAERTEDLRRNGSLDEATFNGLFNGRTGHDLHYLAEVALLKRFLSAKTKERLLDTREWREMSRDRPYSLRYGMEKISESDARKQVDLAFTLTTLILENL